MNLYKGYVPTKDKKSTIPFKGKTSKDLMTLEQVQDLPEYAGVLNDNTILIDIDDGEQAELLMQIVEEQQLDCKVICTSRGKHFLFRNDGVQQCYTHVKVAIGLTVDVKIGSKTSYEVLKVNNEERFIEWDIEEGLEYQTLPKWLTPVKTDIDFLNMKAGDGRNSALFSYELVLQGAGLTKEEAKEAIKIINSHILKEPLSDDELEVVLRDEAFAKPVFYKGKTFLHNVFGDYLMRENHVKRIKGQLHVYREGVYVSGYKYIENSMQKLLPTLTSRQRTETLKYLEVMNPDDNDTETDVNLIAFRNGILNIRTMELLPFSPEYIITNKIPWDYNPNAYSEVLDNALNQWSCNDHEIRLLLEECVGYCLYRKNHLEKAFILTGQGANGKSTFLDVIKNLLGTKNYSPLDLCEMDEQFATTMMNEKLANIGDDISTDYLKGKTLSIFKKAVTGNQFKAENKGVDAYTMKPTAKLLFSANKIPRFPSAGLKAIKRRLVIIPFNATFERQLSDGSENPDYDFMLGEKLKQQSSMEYMILLAVEGLKRALEQKDFTHSTKVQKEMEEFEKDNDPVSQWLDSLKESEEDDEAIINYLTREYFSTIYASYSTFCYENNSKPLKSGNLSKELRKRYNLTSSDNRPVVNGKKQTLLVRN